jgi:Flp pilus assembly protein TadG
LAIATKEFLMQPKVHGDCARFNRRRSRGNITVLAAVLSCFLCAMVAFAVDVGCIYFEKSCMESAAFAASMAGGVSLRNGETNSTIQSTAISFAQLNSPGITNVLRTSDIDTGTWDFDTKAFTAGGSSPNAVRVVIRRDSLSRKIPVYFSKILGASDLDSTVTSITAFDPTYVNGTEFGPLVLVK